MAIAIDNEATGLYPHKGCRAFNISAADTNAKEYLWKFKVNPKTRQVTYEDHKLKDFKATIEKHDTLIFHNANYDIQLLNAIGFDNEYLFNRFEIEDTMVMAHAWKSDSVKGLKELGVTLLDFPEDDEKRLSKITQSAWKKAKKLGWRVSDKNNPHYSLLGTQKEWYKADYWIPELYAEYEGYPADHEWRHICDEYAIKDAVRTIALWDVLQEMMDEQQLAAYHKARRLIKPILQMQYEKVTVLPDQLDEAAAIYYDKTNEQLRKLRKLVDDPKFNPKSPIQLRNVIFQKYKFPTSKVGKTGEPSTDKDVIHGLMKDCPRKKLPNKYKFLVELKKLRKIDNTRTFLKNYKTHKNKQNELQGFYKQWETGTTRLSCIDPNLTNVGKKDAANPFGEEPGLEHLKDLLETEDAFKLRNIFGPKKGEIWTCIDYEKFQLLIFAVVSNSKPLLRAFEEGLDPHDEVAKELFKKDNISAVERTAAKAINFGILFGAGPAKIELIAGMPGLYSLFLSQFPQARKYLNSQLQLAKRKGYVHTLGGYRLYVPPEAPYAASCYVIQGTEAEIVRDAMVDVNEYTYRAQNFYQQWNESNRAYGYTLQKVMENCPYKMIMMVHDELVFKSKSTHPEHLRNIMDIMENAGRKLGIPAKVSADIVTHDWGHKEELQLETVA